jgi:hypothetical protein
MIRNLVFVVYDSILNSVFDGQILKPLLKKLHNNECDFVYLVSFEKDIKFTHKFNEINNLHPNLKLIIFKRNLFISSRFLFFESRKLKKLLKTMRSYDIIARGSLAGVVAQKALVDGCCEQIVVQARGLLAGEYKYYHRNARFILKPVYWWRTRQYFNVELQSYCRNQKFKNYFIEAVSGALRDFLVRTYQADAQRIFLAQWDVPQSFLPAQVAAWRKGTRETLGISEKAVVYCFAGAVKAWQCPDLVISFFEKKYKENKSSFFLVLTFDVKEFSLKLSQVLPSSSYHVLCSAHEKIYEYLSASDYGVVFREDTVVSWVARPVKAMEYQAVGLKIIHNQTVDWLNSLDA